MLTLGLMGGHDLLLVFVFRVLVTGANGFVGRVLSTKLLQDGVELRVQSEMTAVIWLAMLSGALRVMLMARPTGCRPF